MKDLIKTLLDSIWNSSDTPRLIVDATARDVLVPEHLRARFGSSMPIDLVASYPLNLAFDEDALRVDLAFSGEQMRCTFPWPRIRAIVSIKSGVAMVFRPDAPPQREEVRGPFRVIRGGKSDNKPN